jgi:hypothetical protein
LPQRSVVRYLMVWAIFALKARRGKPKEQLPATYGQLTRITAFTLSQSIITNLWKMYRSKLVYYLLQKVRRCWWPNDHGTQPNKLDTDAPAEFNHTTPRWWRRLALMSSCLPLLLPLSTTFIGVAAVAISISVRRDIFGRTSRGYSKKGRVAIHAIWSWWDIAVWRYIAINLKSTSNVQMKCFLL